MRDFAARRPRLFPFLSLASFLSRPRFLSLPSFLSFLSFLSFFSFLFFLVRARLLCFMARNCERSTFCDQRQAPFARRPEVYHSDSAHMHSYCDSAIMMMMMVMMMMMMMKMMRMMMMMIMMKYEKYEENMKKWQKTSFVYRAQCW
jgi:hypothetical protein